MVLGKKLASVTCAAGNFLEVYGSLTDGPREEAVISVTCSVGNSPEAYHSPMVPGKNVIFIPVLQVILLKCVLFCPLRALEGGCCK